MEKVNKLNGDLVNVLKAIESTEGMPPAIARLTAMAKTEGANFCYNAPTLILVSNQKSLDNCMADSVCVLENMMLAANSLGVGTCWLNIFTRMGENPGVKKIFTELGIPEDHMVCGCLAVGYPDGEIRGASPRKEGTVNVIS